MISFNKESSTGMNNEERPDLIYKIDEPKSFKIQEEIGEHLDSE